MMLLMFVIVYHHKLVDININISGAQFASGLETCMLFHCVYIYIEGASWNIVIAAN